MNYWVSPNFDLTGVFVKLSQWWLDKVYLEPRCSLLIACNPATLYPKAAYETTDQQLAFATKYILGFLDFKKYLEE
jgi:hypothetical protein